MMDCIRVFPRRVNDWTPTDDLAIVGEPPLFSLPDLPVYISVTFTWDKAKGQRLLRAWRSRSDQVALGGPAFETWADPYFVPGRFVKEGVTITSRGCPKRCPWCLVPKREGKLCEINIAPGHIVQDNNLLACSRDHIEKVFEMLRQQKDAVSFPGGLDIDYLEPWHVEQFKRLKLDKSALWVACDSDAQIARLDKATDLLSDFSIEKKRCYVLVGFNDETQDEAAVRCRAILQKGFLPFAQLYQGPDSDPGRGEWTGFCHYWSSPKYYRKKEGLA